MEHHHGMSHGDMDMGDDQCSMNMLFNVDYHNLCIVFPSWHIKSFSGFLFSLVAIVVLGAGYEAVREISRRVEAGASNPIKLTARSDGRARNGEGSEEPRKSLKALLYAVQVFYSFFIMLLFMTYNLWIMLAVAVGAFVGYMMFGGSSATKTVACH